MGAFTNESLGNSSTDTRGSTGDDGNLASERKLGVEGAGSSDTISAVGSAGRTRRLTMHPATSIPVTSVCLQQLSIHLRPLKTAKSMTSGVILQCDDTRQELFLGHTRSQDVDGQTVITTLGRTTLLLPQGDPRLPVSPGGWVAELAELVEEDATVDRVAVTQVIDALIGVDVITNGDNTAANVVDGSHLDVPIRNLWGDAEMDRLDDECTNKVVGVGRTSLGVSTKRSNTNDVGGQATLGRLQHELFGNPLGLTVAIEQLLWHLLEWHDLRLRPSGLRRWEHTVGRDVLNGGVAEESETENLTCTFDVGVTQSCVWVDQVDLSCAVDNGIDPSDEILVDFGTRPRRLRDRLAGSTSIRSSIE